MSDFYQLRLRACDYRFPEKLTEGLILKRPNRFIMEVLVNGEKTKAHCPNTGKIGSIVFENIPVLLSYHGNPNRKMKWTVEAISFDKPEKKNKTWIGVNTGATNRYIEHFLKHGMLNDMVEVKVPTQVKREQKLGTSRIDFRVGHTYMEVKTWTQIIEKKVPDWIRKREVKEGSYSAAERLVKHAHELTSALKAHQRCIMLGCYQYVPDKDAEEHYDHGELYSDAKKIVEAFDEAHRAGVESWKCQMTIDPEKVKLIGYWREE